MPLTQTKPSSIPNLRNPCLVHSTVPRDWLQHSSANVRRPPQTATAVLGINLRRLPRSLGASRQACDTANHKFRTELSEHGWETANDGSLRPTQTARHATPASIDATRQSTFQQSPRSLAIARTVITAIMPFFTYAPLPIPPLRPHPSLRPTITSPNANHHPH